MKPTRRYSFCFFTHKTQNKSGTTKLPVVEQRSTQNQTCMKHRGIILELREIQLSTQVIWKYFTKK